MRELPLKDIRSSAYQLARHEAGHFVVARALGYPSNEVFIVWSGPDKSGHGGNSLTLDKQLTSLDEVATYCTDRVLILYAGSMAENVLCGQINDELVCAELKTEKAVNDYSKLRENLRIIAGIERHAEESPQAAIDRINNKLWQQASSLVLKFNREIEQLAVALQQQINAPGEKAVIMDWTSPNLGAARQRC